MFSKKKILITGAAILDILVSPAEPDVFVTGSYPAGDIKMSFGGDALNEAIVLTALGQEVYLNTVVGHDSEGHMIQSHCNEMGIKLNENCIKDGLQTGINVVLVRGNGERHFLTNKNGSLRKLTKEDVLAFMPDDAGIFCFASMFVFPDIGPKEMEEVFRTAKEKGMIVCADMTKRKNGERVEDLVEALQYMDYLLPNEEEAYLVTGVERVEDAAKILFDAGVSCVVIKCGKKGCYLYNEHGGQFVPPERCVEPVDTTGAGDSFAAGFLYGLAEGWNVEKCAKYANQCGEKAVSHIGATAWCGRTTIKNMS